MLTFDVLKWDKSNFFNDEHEPNKEFIYLTLEVSKLDKSISSNETHP